MDREGERTAADWQPPLRALIGIAVVGLALRLALAWQKADTLLVFCLPDDAYYYFQIARNAVSGHGISFDGVSPTNGFHPLWFAMLLPIFAALPGAEELPIHLSLTLGALLDGCTAVLIGMLAYRLIGRRDWAAIFAALYALNPYAVHASINGLETAVSLLMIAVFVYQYIRIRDMAEVRTRDLAWLAVCGGLLLAARTDNIFLWGLVGLALISALPANRKAAFVGLYAAGAAVVLAPWLIWNMVTFGTIMQVSGVAVPYMVKQVVLVKLGATSGTSPVLLKTLVKWTLANWKGALAMAMPPVIVVPLLFFCLGACSCGWDERRRERHRWLLARIWPVVVAAALLVAYHVLGRWYEHLREWYSASTIPAGLLLLAAIVAMLRELKGGGWLRSWPRYVAVPLVILVVLGLGYKSQKIMRWARYPWQDSYKQAALWLNDNTKPEARVGAFNAGIVGYYCDRTVFNLDGAVNNEIYSYILSHRIGQFVRDRDIEYVVDHPYEYTEGKKLLFWGDAPLPVVDGKEVHRIDNSDTGYDDIAIFRMPGSDG